MDDAGRDETRLCVIGGYGLKGTPNGVSFFGVGVSVSLSSLQDVLLSSI